MKLPKARKSAQADVKGICGAKTRSGGVCRKQAGWGTDHFGVGRCRLHGGATPRATESPRFKHGVHCRYLPRPAEGEEITADVVESALEEVVGAVAWAKEFCETPGPKPPLMVLSALRTVVDIKERALRMKQALQQRMVLSPEDVGALVGIFTEALARAQVPDTYRRAVATALRQIARERFGPEVSG